MIQIDKARCISCGRCCYDCFPGALAMSAGTPTLVNPEACLACGHCIAVCPKAAVADDTLNMEESMSVGTLPAADSLLQLMRFRRSCRHYTAKPVTGEELAPLLEAARACPTAKNLQATRYITVTEKIPVLLDAALQTLGAIGEHQLTATDAPDELRRARNFIAWRDRRREDPAFDPLFFHAPRLLLFVSDKSCARDAAAGAAYAELMAAASGLGCLYSGYFTACVSASSELKTLLQLRPGEELVRCLVLGHPDIRFLRTAPRRPADLTIL